MSFGLLCYRIRNVADQPTSRSIEYLMIQRKDSLAFMEFVRGKYDLANKAYINHLLSFMTHIERQQLLSATFNDLWNQVLCQNFIPRHTQDYNDARVKFETLQKISLETLVRNTTTDYTEPEWGFPKGRRRLREDDVDCAMREFCEETGVVKGDIELMRNAAPYEEIFYGTNNVLYRHVYYCAQLCRNVDREFVVDPTNMNQAREVRQVCWFPYDQVLRRIRSHNKERKALFMNAHNDILRVVDGANGADESELKKRSIETALTSICGLSNIILNPNAVPFYCN
jgi:8-oxo-dGTP pyrophosphatase MutT (NUDIX family)